MIYPEMVYHYIVSLFWAQMFNKTSLVEKMGVYWMIGLTVGKYHFTDVEADCI